MLQYLLLWIAATIFLLSLHGIPVAIGKEYNLTRSLADDVKGNQMIENLIDAISISDGSPEEILSKSRRLRAAFGQTNFKKLPDYFRVTDSGELWTLQSIDRDESAFCGELRCCNLPVCEIRFHVVFTATPESQNNNIPSQPTGSISIKVTVAIVDRNDHAPAFSRDMYVAKFVEESPAYEQLVSLLPAHDADSVQNGVRDYVLRDPSNIFQLVMRNGVPGILSKRRLDYEVPSDRQFFLQLLAVDKGRPERTGSLNVSVILEDVNDHSPQFYLQQNGGGASDTVTLTLAENSTFHEPILRLNATDQDTGKNGELRFHFGNWMSTINPVVDKFNLDPVSGDMYLQMPLDFETYVERDFSLTVVVSDQGQPPQSSSATVRILLTDINDNAPFFNVLQNSSISENRSPGELALRLLLRDEDTVSQDQVTCAIHPNQGSQFRLDNTTRTSFFLYSNVTFDYEVTQGVYVRIVCVDQAQPIMTVTHSLFVSVSDVNDNSPIFLNETYNFLVPEDLRVGQTVGQVHASDKDVSRQYGKVTYVIETPHSGQFSLYPDTGVLVLLKPLDYENATETTFHVRAMDGEERFSRALVRVLISDVNDNKPLLVSESILYISENTAPKTIVTKVKFEDADSGDNGAVRMRLTEQSASPSIPASRKYFELHSTGELLIVNSLDRETLDTHLLTVVAQDLSSKNPLSTEVILRVIVDDVNDNRPQLAYPSEGNVLGFSPPIYENSPMNTVVDIIRGEDQDMGSNAQISYHLKSTGNGSAHFRVNTTTGHLLTDWLSMVDGPVAGVYEVVIEMADHGDPPLSSEARLFVNVAEAGENGEYASQFQIFPSNLNNMIILVLIVVVSIALATGLIVAIIWVRGRTFGTDIPLDFSSTLHGGSGTSSGGQSSIITKQRLSGIDQGALLSDRGPSSSASFHGANHPMYYECGGILYSLVNSPGSVTNMTNPQPMESQYPSGLTLLSSEACQNPEQYAMLQHPGYYPVNGQYQDDSRGLQTFTPDSSSKPNLYSWNFPYPNFLDENEKNAFYEPTSMCMMGAASTFHPSNGTDVVTTTASTHSLRSPTSTTERR